MRDAAVVGSGPNGLAAAVLLARAGLQVDLFEASSTIGGGTRTQELIAPEHWHDVCSAVHPMAFASPFFREFGLAEKLEWFTPEISYGNPLDGGRAGLAYHSLDRTVEGLGRDGAGYRRLMGPLVDRVQGVLDVALHPVLRIPRDPLAFTALALGTLWQGSPAWNLGFHDQEAPALLTGAAVHTVAPQPSLSSAAAGLVLTNLAHTVGWPIPRGGSAQISQTMLDDFLAHGGTLHTDTPITDLGELEEYRATLLDVGPRGLLSLAGERLPDRYAAALRRYRYNNAACKVDFILSGPVPWQNPELALAGTVHAGGSRAEMALSERQVARGEHPTEPYVLLSQPSSFDPSRAPAGRHVLWTYCHVPAGSTRDMRDAVVRQLERFAPGFRDLIVSSRATTAAQLAEYNANYVGGDFGTGVPDLRQLIARPTLSLAPWNTPLAGTYLCSAAAPPGPGVHGMGGYHAATRALKEIFGLKRPSLR
ncbi:phytoene desaturase family protein [Psychromicrobium xiongbiense]|uniref:phytoene desaturase family protein n=1 Tax=Psychromicrobium xiongbiense TaxID=3051184 RepID=UPI002553BDEE|nr:NAD(P)/FAD-dependent oxidoreductase [Psychromicrobium sp. YIM S02556]